MFIFGMIESGTEQVEGRSDKTHIPMTRLNQSLDHSVLQPLCRYLVWFLRMTKDAEVFARIKKRLPQGWLS